MHPCSTIKVLFRMTGSKELKEIAADGVKVIGYQ
jgi:hypothetical protein